MKMVVNDYQQGKEYHSLELGTPRVLARRTTFLVKHNRMKQDSDSFKLAVGDFFWSLFISAPISICVMEDGEFRLVNPQFQRYTGYNEEELFGTDALARIDHRFGNEGDFGRPERFSESFAIDPVQVE